VSEDQDSEAATPDLSGLPAQRSRQPLESYRRGGGFRPKRPPDG
jgi:hypothetical protein